jgi:hypothetical protein
MALIESIFLLLGYILPLMCEEKLIVIVVIGYSRLIMIEGDNYLSSYIIEHPSNDLAYL